MHANSSSPQNKTNHQKHTPQTVFQSLLNFAHLNKIMGSDASQVDQKEDFGGMEKADIEKQKQYQKEFSAVVDNDINTNQFNSWTQQRELNQVIRELTQEPNDFLTAMGENIQSKFQSILNGEHMKELKSERNRKLDNDKNLKEKKHGDHQNHTNPLKEVHE